MNLTGASSDLRRLPETSLCKQYQFIASLLLKLVEVLTWLCLVNIEALSKVSGDLRCSAAAYKSQFKETVPDRSSLLSAEQAAVGPQQQTLMNDLMCSLGFGAWAGHCRGTLGLVFSCGQVTSAWNASVFYGAVKKSLPYFSPLWLQDIISKACKSDHLCSFQLGNSSNQIAQLMKNKSDKAFSTFRAFMCFVFQTQSVPKILPLQGPPDSRFSGLGSGF